MLLNFTQEKKKQKYLIIILVFFTVLAVAIFWFGSGKQNFPNSSVNEKMGAFSNDKIANNQFVQIDFSIFENALLKKLEPFIQIPKYEGSIGRENPFKK